MSLVLVVEPDARAAGRVAEALGSEGWQIKVVEAASEALAFAAAQAPKLVIVSGELAEARELLRSFARHRGGPGALVLLSDARAAGASAAAFGADELVRKPFTPSDLRLAVRRCLAASRSAPVPRAADDRPRLSSQDIFGDVLAEIERGERPPVPRAAGAVPGGRAPSDEIEIGIEKRLEETLAGVLSGSAVRATARPVKAAAGSDIDALLDKTLADLKLSPKAPRASDAPAPRVPGSPQPERSAAASAPPPRPSRPIGGAGEVAPPPSAGADFGQYTLEERIAVGGMAEVWKARMKGFEGFQKTVAIKRILPHLTSDENFVTMFIDEAKLAAQLNHNHIIQIYDLGKAGSDYYIAMEYVDGHDLRAVLRAARRSGRPFPLGLGIYIASLLADALDHAHRKRDFDNRELGLVHRDISPQNVLISNQGEVKLCDFGIAKAMSKAGETQLGALKGKIPYMSPEQAWGREVDARSDIFSLGALLYELLTGEALFQGETEVAVLEAVRACHFRDPRQVNAAIPESVVTTLRRALEQDPADRFATAGELHRELNEFLASLNPRPGRVELALTIARLLAAAPRHTPAREPAAAVSAAARLAPPEPSVPARAAPPPVPRAAAPVAREPSSPPVPAPAAVAATPVQQPAAPAQSKPVQADVPAPAEHEPEPPVPAAPLQGKAKPPAAEIPPVGEPAPATLPRLTARPPLALVPPPLPQLPELPPHPPVAEAPFRREDSGNRTMLWAGVAVAVVLGIATILLFIPAEPEPEAAAAPDSVTAEVAGDPPAEVPTELEGADGAAGPAEGGDAPADPAAIGGGEAESAPAPAATAAQAEQSPVGGASDPASGEASEEAAEPPAAAVADAPPPPAAPIEAADAGESEPDAAAPAPESPVDASPADAQAERPGAGEGTATAPAEERAAASPPAETAVAPDPAAAGASDREAAASGTAVAVGDLVGPGPGVVPPVLVSFTKPGYPPLARRLKVGGTVVIAVLVDENGRAAEWRLVRSVSAAVGINEAVIEAVKQAKFEPATKDGVKVKMWYQLVVPFKF